jgi:type I restriction enzyme R subunit
VRSALLVGHTDPTSGRMITRNLSFATDCYEGELDEDGQVAFKGKAKAFVRTHQFLASILPYSDAEWEKLSIFLNFLIPKLPAPVEEDLSRGILESIDMDSYRNEVSEAMKLSLPDEDAELEPVPTSGGGHKPEPELDHLSSIIQSFNDEFGNIPFEDRDRVARVIAEELPEKVAANKAYQNAMRNSDKAAARLEHDHALMEAILSMFTDHADLYKHFSDDPNFRRWLSQTVFAATYDGNSPPAG